MITCSYTRAKKKKKKKRPFPIKYVQRPEAAVCEASQREAPALQPSAAHAEAHGHGHCSAQADYGA